MQSRSRSAAPAGVLVHPAAIRTRGEGLESNGNEVRPGLEKAPATVRSWLTGEGSEAAVGETGLRQAIRTLHAPWPDAADGCKVLVRPRLVTR